MVTRAISCTLLAFGVGLAAVWLAAAPTGAQTPPTQPPDYTVEDEMQLPGHDGGQPVPVGSRPSSAPPECVWTTISEDYLWALSYSIAGTPRPSPDAIPQVYMCNGAWVGGEENFRWVTAAPAGPTMTADELAQTIYARLEGNLPQPEVESDPALGEPAIISFPTFVQIANWAGTITDQECDPTGLLCVTVTATPALSFSPGEPGASTIACASGGTRFVEGGAISSVQAAQPGACAYAYQMRTGTGSRPPEWPGIATVTWGLGWESTSGATGPLPDIVRTADVARQVNEVQTVIEQ
jgi:hypothetical protein